MNPGKVFRSLWTLHRSFVSRRLALVFVAGRIGIGWSDELPPTDPLSTWYFRTNTSSMFRPFATGEGVIVAGDDRGGIYASRNGANWSRRESGTNIIVRGLAYGNGRFVALFAVAGFSTSEDGLSWTTPVATMDRNIDLFDLEYGQGAFIAGGYRMTPPCREPIRNRITVSLKSIVWSRARALASNSQPLRA